MSTENTELENQIEAQVDADLAGQNPDYNPDEHDDNIGNNEHDEFNDDEHEENPQERRKSGFEKRVHKLNKRYEKSQQEVEYWKNLALENQKNPAANIQPEQHAIDTSKPRIEQFNDIGAYTDALTEWKLAQHMQKMQEQQKIQAQQQYYQDLEKKYETIQNKYVESHPEYVEDLMEANEIMRDEGLTVPADMQVEIVGSEFGPQIYHYFAKHLDDLRKISQMSASRRLVELGKIEARIAQRNAPQSRKAPTAPAPMTPSIGKAPTLSKTNTNDPDSIAELMRERNRRDRGR